VAGVARRLFVLWRLPAPSAGDAPARQNFGTTNAIQASLSRMIPHRGFHSSATLPTINPYVFHIGLVLVFFGYGPHIAFIHRMTGLTWPDFPDTVMYLAAAATLMLLLIARLFRLTDPVLKKISRPDDMLTWAVTMLPLMTGMAVLGEPSVSLLAHASPLYRGPVALHLLSLELLLVWFPFGKLMHAFLVRPNRMRPLQHGVPDGHQHCAGHERDARGALGSRLGVGLAELLQTVEALRAQGTTIPLDKPQADVMLVSTVIDVLLFPDSLAATARILNHLGVS
jgi:nitrate reductase gamma subunit